MLSIGQNLYIPSKETDVTTGEYVVKSGDTLYAIAQKYGTTVDNLKSINDLTTDSLAIGQILKVPTESNGTDNDTYTVKSGDTLYGIANKYNTTVDAIKDLNNLTSNTLSIGQTLKIPSNSDSAVTTNTYTVVKGDTLYGIAQKFGTTVDELKTLNNLSSNALSIGETLKVPNKDNVIYTVKSGDTLYSIAREFGTTVSAITALNNLATTVLSIGQKLLLP